ncbi:MAG: urease accessory UreF family protein [Pseudomonadota bacterium]
MTEIPTGALGRLFAWLSPGFPVGAFAYSHGLEQAVAEGAVRDGVTLEAWIADALAHGAGRTDAILAAHASRADESDCDALADLARALQPSAERAAEAAIPGAAFARTAREGWGIAIADAPYPVAVGAAAGQAGLTPAVFLPLMLQAFAANLISAGVRLIPIGQTEGQQVLCALLPLIERVAAEAGPAALAQIGSAGFAIDIASLRHESLEPRLFRA